MGKLITASQLVDFVTILVSDDRENEYVEYQTYKVEAGLNLEDDSKSVKILNPPIGINRSVLRSKLKVDKYDEYVKPVRTAYSLKAGDIAVEYELLKNARENISEDDAAMFNFDLAAIPEPEKLQYTPVHYLPCYFETYGNTLDYIDNSGIRFSEPTTKFERDAIKVYIGGKGKHNYIEVGYTGKTFPNDTFASFKKRLRSDHKDLTVYSYFDPIDDQNSKQVLSYASDNYRTAFVLHSGKLYYINAHATDLQTIQSMSSVVLYLAMSMRFDDDKEDVNDDYIKYIENFESSIKFLRNKKHSEFAAVVNEMIDGRTDIDNFDKMLLKTAKYFSHEKTFDLNNKDLMVDNDLDKLIKDCNYLYDSNKSDTALLTEEARTELLEEASSRGREFSMPIRNNLQTYFIQNEDKFGLSEDEKNRYLNDIIGSALTVDRSVLESFDTDKERNDFYEKLFTNAFQGDKKPVIERHADCTFFITDKAYKALSGTGNLYERMKKRNGGIIPIGNTFIYVFSESEFPLLSDVDTSSEVFNNMAKTVNDLTRTVHALVFDSCSVRLFCCLDDDDTIFEAIMKTGCNILKFIFQSRTEKTGKTFINQILKNAPEHVYFWDWKKLNIYKDGNAFLGFDFTNTANYDNVGKSLFEKTSQPKETRSVGEILVQLQNAYENDSFHYELAQDFFDRQVRNYLYEKLWRPSLQIGDTEADHLERYNYIWSE